MTRSVFVFSCNDDLLAYKRGQWADAVMELDSQISDEEIRHDYRQQHGLPPHAVVTDDQVTHRRQEQRQRAFEWVCAADALYSGKED